MIMTMNLLRQLRSAAIRFIPIRTDISGNKQSKGAGLIQKRLLLAVKGNRGREEIRSVRENKGNGGEQCGESRRYYSCLQT